MLRKLYLVFAFFLFIVAFFLGIDRLCHHTITQFSPHKIRTSNLFIPSQKPMLSLEKKEEIEGILSQKFVFYHKGKTSYSFISEDGNYILKFMRTQRVKPKSWLAYLPFAFNRYYEELISKKEEMHQLVTAWRFAFENLQEETGLVYVHTSRKERVRKRVTVLDKNLEPYTLDLDKTIFCIQKHSNLFYMEFSQLLQDNDITLAKERITSLFSLISSLCCKGVLSPESVRSFDVGVLGNQVIQVDIDKLCSNSICICKKHCQETMVAMIQNFRSWLETHGNVLVPYFDECLEKASSNLCKEDSH